MIGRCLDLRNDQFRHKDDDEFPRLSEMCTLFYLAQYIRPYITFSINLLARFNSRPMQRHQNDVKNVI